MASQAHNSPQQRTRKPPLPPQIQSSGVSVSVSMHGGPTSQASSVRRERERESSPSPSLREQQQQAQQQAAQAQAQRQRYVRTQSMPIVATQTHTEDFDFEFDDPPPSSSSTSVVQQGQQQAPVSVGASSGQQQQQQAQQQQQQQAAYAQQRPVPISRVSQPAFIQGRPTGMGPGGVVGVGVGVGVAEKWQMTEDLQADIDRADLLQQQAHQRQQSSHSPVGVGVGLSVGGGMSLPTSITIPPPGTNPAPGTAGVAYAGGAASAGAAFVSGHVKSLSSSNSSGDVMEGSSPIGASASASASALATASAAASSAAALARRRTIAAEQSTHRASPLSYALRKGANTSPGYPVAAAASMPSPRSMKNRTPDRSLPVQEEPDEHDQHHQHQQQQQQHRQTHQHTSSGVGTGSGRVTPASIGSDHSTSKDLDHDGEGTLVDLGDDDDDEEAEERGGGGGSGGGKPGGGTSSGTGTQESTEGEGSHTPRSPTNTLYPHSHGVHAHTQFHGHGLPGGHALHHQRSIHEVLLPDKQTHPHVNGNRKAQAQAPSSSATNGATAATAAAVAAYATASASNSFNAQDFQQTLRKLQSHPLSHSQSSSPYPTYPPYAPTSTHPPSMPPPPFSPFSRAEFSRNESRGSYPNWMFDFYHNYPGPGEEVVPNGAGGAGGDGYYEYDEAATAYMQQFLPATGGSGTGTGLSASSGSSGHVYPYAHVQGHAHMRPDAPIPPTPHSQTSAPTPFRRQNVQQQQQHQRRDSRDSRDSRGRSGSRGRAQEDGGIANEDAEGEEEDEEQGGGGVRDVVDDSAANRDDRPESESRSRNGTGAGAQPPTTNLAAAIGISQDRFVPSFSPIPPSGTPYPYPYPFSHVRRVGGYVYPRGASHPSQVPPPPPSVPIHPGQIASAIPRVPSSMYEYGANANNGNISNGVGVGVSGGGMANDPSLAQLQLEEQFRLQMQMYAYNNALGDGGAMSDSTLSPASTPYPGMSPGYTPFGAFLSQRKFARGGVRGGVGVGYGGVGGGGGLPGEDGRLTVASFRSSPSHSPVPLPPMPPALYGGAGGGMRGRGVKKQDRVSDLRREAGGGLGGPGGAAGGGVKVNGTGAGTGAGGRMKPPPRVGSTQPRDTTPEPISEEDEDSGEETAGEKYEHEHREHLPSHLTPGYAQSYPPNWSNRNRRINGHGHGHATGMGLTRENDEEIDNGEWVDEETDEEEELLDLEFHPSYVTNTDRRRRKWEQRWDDLVQAFQALDRETDTTLLLLASPPHTNKLYSLSSRSIRRDAQLFDGHAMHGAKNAFSQIASQRRSARSQRRASLLERLYYASSSSFSSYSGAPSQSQDGAGSGGQGQGQANGEGDENAGAPDSGAGTGAPNTSGGATPGGGAGTEANDREEDLRRLLRTALHSLSALHQMYEEREARWRIEERRMREEREGVDLLVRQAFGTTVVGVGAGLNPMGGMGEHAHAPPPPFLNLD